MIRSTYIERINAAGSFKTRADCARWCREKQRDGYSVKGPFNSKQFAFSSDYPWEATAIVTFTVESNRS